MDPTMSREQAEHLAAFLCSLRPDWYVPETVAALGQATQRGEQPSAYRIAVAAIRCAANPANGTPKRIAEHGHHWQPWPDEPVATPTPPQIQTCEHCGGYLSDTNREQHLNRQCMSEHQREVYARGASAARAALAEARHTTTEEATT